VDEITFTRNDWKEALAQVQGSLDSYVSRHLPEIFVPEQRDQPAGHEIAIILPVGHGYHGPRRDAVGRHVRVGCRFVGLRRPAQQPTDSDRKKDSLSLSSCSPAKLLDRESANKRATNADLVKAIT
jgi:hypothetical protein